MLPASISRLIAHIAALQKPDGGFESATAPGSNGEKRETRRTVFYSALVLGALNCVARHMPPHAQGDGVFCATLEGVRRRAAEFLLRERSPHYSWNYWLRGSKEAREHPYPDDLDDTSLALYALHGYDLALVGGAACAAYTKLLLATEAEEGGPYRTWLVPADHQHLGNDVDAYVNANIRAMLAALGVELPALETYFDGMMRGDSWRSPYYAADASFWYFFSRAPDGAGSTHAARLLRAPQHAATPLDRALLASARAHCGIATERDATLPAMFASAAIEPYPFGVERKAGGTRYMSGCEALTAALFAEAIVHGPGADAAPHSEADQFTDQSTEVFVKQVLAKAELDYLRKRAGIDRDAAHYLKSVLADSERYRVIALPHDLYRAFRTDRGVPADLAWLRELGLAGWCGSVGYTLADDIVDGDRLSGVLPVANLLMRASFHAYCDVARRIMPALGQVVVGIYRDMDNALAWELSHARAQVEGDAIHIAVLPDYADNKVLAARSMGHALGALIVCAAHGHGPEGAPFHALRAWFYHYTIARQLHDDAHDWPGDLARGHITSVAAMMLRIKPFSVVGPRERAALQRVFWERGMERVAEEIGRHTNAAQDALRTLASVMDIALLRRMLEKIEQGTAAALKERTQTLDFLSSYRL